MKTTLLSTVAAAALALGCAVASAQDTKAPAASGGVPSGAMERSAPAGGAAEHTPAQPKADRQAQTPPAGTRTDERNAQAPSASKSGGRMSSEKTAPDHDAQRTGDNTTKPGTNDRSGVSTSSDTRAKTTVGAAPSSETRMTTEQRTQIREKVIATGPKVTNVNFSLNVGTVVPNTVRVVEVPPVIVDLHPEWRGYRYFVANDQVIIVDRTTLRIIAVLDV